MGPLLETDTPIALWVGHTESDNISRGTFDQEGSYTRTGISFDLARDTTRAELELDGDVEHRDYAGDDFPDEQVGDLQGSAALSIVPQRFDWVTWGGYGHVKIDPFEPSSPSNRQQYRSVSTQPTLTMPLGGRTALELSSTYTRSRYDDSNSLDEESLDKEIGLTRQVNAVTAVGIHVRDSQLEFGDTQRNYDLTSVELRLDRATARGSYLAAVGENEIDFSGQKTAEPTFRLAMNRALGNRSSLNVELGQEFTSVGGVLSRQDTEIERNPEDLFLASGPLLERRAAVRYGLEGLRTSFTASLMRVEQEYAAQPEFDNEYEGPQLSLRRLVTMQLTLGAAWEQLERFYRIDGRRDEETVAAIWLERKLGRHFSIIAYTERFERQGTFATKERLYDLRFLYYTRASR